jgi:hypothetical protein
MSWKVLQFVRGGIEAVGTAALFSYLDLNGTATGQDRRIGLSLKVTVRSEWGSTTTKVLSLNIDTAQR